MKLALYAAVSSLAMLAAAVHPGPPQSHRSSSEPVSRRIAAAQGAAPAPKRPQPPSTIHRPGALGGPAATRRAASLDGRRVRPRR